MLHILSLAALVAFVDAERYSEVEQALMLKSVMDCMGAAEVAVWNMLRGYGVINGKISGAGVFAIRFIYREPQRVFSILIFFVLSKNVMEWWGLL